jgi:hypothetical protein
MTYLSKDQFTSTTNTLLSVASVWALAVCVGATSGFLASLYRPVIGAIVAATIIVPTLIYLSSARLKAYADQIGQRRIVLFHTWRIAAALLFFWFGARSELPPLFWILAGGGDFLVGCLAVVLLRRPESFNSYQRFHLFGFADFIVAVGTGLTFTLLGDPLMAPVAALPLALIPLFGVGISGMSHLVAFDMLRRGTGLSDSSKAHSNKLGGPLAQI